MKAFLTGSRAYGTPKKSSDVDIVISCEEDLAALLRKRNPDPKIKQTGIPTTLRVGELNLILPKDDVELAIWKLGTEILLHRKRKTKSPQTREEAKKVFDDLRTLVGRKDTYKGKE